MSRPAVHQFLPSFAGRDAIGRHTLQARRLLRDAGFHSEIYAGEALREVARMATPYQQFTGGPPGQTWLLYQCSTGSPVGTFVSERPEPLIVDYHNITPAELFAPWEPHVGVELAAGRHQLAELAEPTVLGLADSSFNEAELVSLGFRRTAVASILLDEADFAGTPDPAVLGALEARRRAGGADWLFVGRISPNKAQHDVVRALAVYRELVDPRARLTFVGGSSSHRYLTALEEYVAALGLEQAVTFAGSVSHEALLAHYRVADVFVCLSDHEGFCVPLLEAMHAGVPVVAYAATAVPETLGDAGLLLPGKAPLEVALAVERVLGDGVLREALLANAARRLERFSLARTSQEFLAAVQALVGESL